LSATPALIVWGFLGVFDAFEVSTLYLSDGLKETLPLALSCVVLATRARRWSSRAGMQMEWGDTRVDVIAPLTHRLFSETNDNFVGILLTYGSACLLLAGDARRRPRSI
jgi:beta-lactamase superfamily II metal-dependent hydrolase